MVLWLTPTLLLFEATPPEAQSCVLEVTAEIILPRRGERDERGLPLEPDEPLSAHLHSITVLSGNPPAMSLIESWLEEETLRLYASAAGASGDVLPSSARFA